MRVKLRKALTLLIFLLTILIWSCTTASIRSEPTDASIYVLNAETGERQQAARTPWEGSIQTLTDLAGSNRVILELEHESAEIYRVVLPSAALSSLHLKVQMEEKKENSKGQDSRTDPLVPLRMADQAVSMALMAQNLILQKKYDEAYAISSEILKLDERILVGHHLQGAVHFLRKEYERSQLAWQRVLELNSKDAEAQLMLQRISLALSGSAGEPHE